MHTGLVQVVRQLYRRLHLHIGLKDAAADRGLVVGLLRLGLDGCLHPALGDVRGDGAAPAHSGSPSAPWSAASLCTNNDRLVAVSLIKHRGPGPCRLGADHADFSNPARPLKIKLEYI